MAKKPMRKDDEYARWQRDMEDSGKFWGTLEYLSEMPGYGTLLDPLGFFSDETDSVPMHDVSEQLSPDVKARAQQSIDAARRLRGGPLVSGMQARKAGDAGIRRQAAAMAGGTPASQRAVRQQGAGMGAQILGQYGGQMAGESVERYMLGTKMAQAGAQLEQGQVLFSLGEKLRNYLARKGIQVNEQQAKTMALSTGASFAADQWGGDGTEAPKVDAPTTPMPTGNTATETGLDLAEGGAFA